MKLSIVFGALAPKLHVQCGYKDTNREKSRWRFLQSDADAVTRLQVRNLLSESQAHRIRQRLMKRILQLAGSVGGGR